MPLFLTIRNEDELDELAKLISLSQAQLTTLCKRLEIKESYPNKKLQIKAIFLHRRNLKNKRSSNSKKNEVSKKRKRKVDNRSEAR
jgi:hypothetical protein